MSAGSENFTEREEFEVTSNVMSRGGPGFSREQKV